MDDVLELEWASTKDELMPRRNGDMDRTRVYVFFLGRFGPFTERVALPIADDAEINRRIEKLREQLRAQQRA